LTPHPDCSHPPQCPASGAVIVADPLERRKESFPRFKVNNLSLGGHPAAPWLILAGFVLGGLIALPVTVMVVLAAAAFGPIQGFLVGLGGSTLSACTSFAIGRLLGHRQLAALAGSRVHAVSLKLRAGGVTAIAALRMMPVTHFTVVSLVSGVSHVRLRDFIAGTVIGMAPGVGAIALFFDRLSAATREPNAEHIAWLTGVSIAVLAVLLTMRRLADRRGNDTDR